METLNILLIRHGQTDWNAAGRWQGETDIPLNATGRMQAAACAERLKSWPLTAIYTSDLSRARETADIVAASHNLPVQLEPLWRERNAGEFAGLTHAEIRARVGVNLGTLDNPPGGETLAQVRDRAMVGYKKVVEAHQNGMVVLFAHGNIIAMCVAHLLGIPLAENRRFSVGNNTGINWIAIREGVPRIKLLNCAAHLETVL